MAWLSVADVSDRAGIPPETVRRYITRHSLHLQVKKGHKSYSIAENCIPVFIQIRTLYAAGKTAEDVEAELLRSGRPTIISVNADGESVNVNVIETLAVLDTKMNAIMTMLMNVDERLKDGEKNRNKMNENMKDICEQVLNVHKEVATATEQFQEIQKNQKETRDQLVEIVSRIETHGKRRGGLLGWFKR